MRLFLSILVTMAVAITPATAGSSYLALSFGSSFENHKFDVWNDPAAPGRRDLSAASRSSDCAIALGFQDVFQLGARNLDLELEIFERSNSSFTAIGGAGSHPATIRTTSMLASVWTQIGGGNNWDIRAGAGIGARHSSYRMSGPGISFHTADRAPYAMVGLRLSKHAGERTTLFTELRAHTRPPIHSAGGAMQGPLEHNSKGITLRMGLQINLGG